MLINGETGTGKEVVARQRSTRPARRARRCDAASQTLPRQLEAFERNVLRAALARSDGNVALAAEQLGIAKTTLYDKLKRLHIAPE